MYYTLPTDEKSEAAVSIIRTTQYLSNERARDNTVKQGVEDKSADSGEGGSNEEMRVESGTRKRHVCRDIVNGNDGGSSDVGEREGHRRR